MGGPYDGGVPDATPSPAATTPPTRRSLLAGRVAAVLVALQVGIIMGLAGFYIYELVTGESQDLLIVLMSVVTMLIFVIGLSYTTVGLLRRHPRAQAPAIAFSFLLVPLGIAMYQFAPAWAATGVLLLGVATIAAALLMGKLGD